MIFPENQKSEILLFADEKGNGLSLTVDTKDGKIILDRSKAGVQYATEFGTSRECSIDTKETSANIFVDNSIIEIFINKGEKYLLAACSLKKDKMVLKSNQAKQVERTLN